MPLRKLPTLETSGPRTVFLAAFWAVSAIAFGTRYERVSTLFAGASALLLGLGVGIVLLATFEPLSRRATGRE